MIGCASLLGRRIEMTYCAGDILLHAAGNMAGESRPLSGILETSPLSWTIFNDQQFTEIAPFWNALEGSSCTPMQQYIWSDASRLTLPISGELAIVVVKTGPQTGAIAPLVSLKGCLGRLEHLGVKYLHEPADVLYSDLDALKKLVSALVELRSPIFFERIPANSPVIGLIQEAYHSRGKVFIRSSAPYPRIMLNEDWRDPGSRLSSSWRSSLRRAIRTAEKIGPIRYEILSPRPNELGPLFEQALDIEAANWKGRAGSALALDTVRGKFFRQYAIAASEAGSLRLCFVHIGARAAAMQLAVECAGKFSLLKIGYREEFASCSPGMLLIAETIRYAASKELSSYEFFGSAESWTRTWTKDECDSVSLRVYPIGIRGMAALAVDAAHVGWKRASKIL
jgi:CelD/BcsL family acetyltransferase involved in cellulose biosynthesis